MSLSDFDVDHENEPYCNCRLTNDQKSGVDQLLTSGKNQAHQRHDQVDFASYPGTAT